MVRSSGEVQAKIVVRCKQRLWCGAAKTVVRSSGEVQAKIVVRCSRFCSEVQQR